jgi:hypothetical protein
VVQLLLWLKHGVLVVVVVAVQNLIVRIHLAVVVVQVVVRTHTDYLKRLMLGQR